MAVAVLFLFLVLTGTTAQEMRQHSSSNSTDIYLRRLEGCESDACTIWDAQTWTFYLHCIACSENYYKQDGADAWLPFCPTGFVPNEQKQCKSVKGLAYIGKISFQPDILTNWMKVTDSFGFDRGDVLGGDTEDQDPSDPIPARQRGMYFEPARFAKLKGIKLNHNLSVATWVFNEFPDGTFFSFKSCTPSDTPADLDLIIGGALLDVKFPKVPSGFGTPLQAKRWILLTYTMQWTIGKGYTITLFVGNNHFSKASTSSLVPYHDNGEEEHTIGAEGKSFKGFMYQFTLFHRAISVREVHNEVQLNECQNCWPCDISEYFSGSRCRKCPSDCADTGCVRDSCETLCDDWECSDCETFAMNGACNDCNQTGHAHLQKNSCQCDTARYRQDTHSFCGPMMCDTWKEEYYSYARCEKCSDGSFDIGHQGIKFCTGKCPTGFLENTKHHLCEFPEDTHVLKFNFNLPTSEFTSTGTVATQIEVNRDAPSGYPSKDRGLYFDGENDAFIKIPDLYLSHSYSIHAWTVAFLRASDSTIFSKDSGRFEDANATILNLKILDTGQFGVDLVSQKKTSKVETYGSKFQIPGDYWQYVVFSVKLVAGQDSKVSIWTNTKLRASFAVDGAYVWDGADHPSYLATLRNDVDSYSSKLHGFLYEFHINQEEYQDSTESEFYDTCAEWCWDYCPVDGGCILPLMFDQFYGGTCDYTCDYGCVRDTACVLEQECLDKGGSRFCNLCADREWVECDGYNVGQCTLCGLGDSEVEPLHGSCVCVSSYARSQDDQFCHPCFGGCATCDTYYETFASWTDCGSGYYDTSSDPNFSFCMATCPTKFEVWGETCTLMISDSIISYDFNYPSRNFTNKGKAEYFDVKVFLHGINGQPAKDRGLFFTGDPSTIALIFISGLILNHTFALHFWVLTQISQHNMCLFSKSNTTNSIQHNAQNAQFILNITSQDQLQILMSKDSQDVLEKTIITPDYLPRSQWNYIVTSAEMKNGSSTDISFWINSIHSYTEMAESIFMLDNMDNKAFIASQNIVDDLFINPYSGFLYEFHIYQKSYKGEMFHFNAYGCGGKRSPGSNKCLSFDSFSSLDGVPCDHSCITCVRHSPCHPCLAEEDSESSFCNLCADRECQSCSSYYSGSCSICNTSGGAENQPKDGKCECREDLGFTRISENDICCYKNCGECRPPISLDYSTCVKCETGKFNTGNISGLAYCVSECPTAFRYHPVSNTCEPETNSSLAMGIEFANGIGFELVSSESSGKLLNGRGAYFNGLNDAYASSVSSVVLNHSFSIHAWIYPAKLTKSMAIFSKDRNYNKINHISRQLQCGLTDSGKFGIKMSQDMDTENYQEIKSQFGPINSMWQNIVYSFTMQNHKDTKIEFILDKVAYDSYVLIDTFLDDLSSYPHFVGLERDHFQGWRQHWNGFIYNLLVQNAPYQTKYPFVGSEWASPCALCPQDNVCLWKNMISEYVESSNLPSKSDEVESAPECYDFYCEVCSTRQRSDCSECEGEISEGICTCPVGFSGKALTRDYETDPCCATGCASCTQQEDWQYCGSCQQDMYEQPAMMGLQEEFRVCFAHWPTGFIKEDGETNQCIGTPGKIIELDMTWISRPIINKVLRYPQFAADPASVLGRLFDDALPYYMRGAWFNQNRGLVITDVVLSHSFTLVTWLYLETSSETNTILTKTADENTPDVIQIQVEKNKPTVALYSPRSQEFSAAQGSRLNVYTWENLSIVVVLDGKKTQVHFYISGRETSIESLDGYLHDKPLYKIMMIGVSAEQQEDEVTPVNPFAGFIYALELHNAVLDDSKLASYIQNECIGAWTLWPTHGECLWTARRDEMQLDDGSVRKCHSENETDVNDCHIDNGCRRPTDCSRCHDPACETCINFESHVDGYLSCHQCMPGAEMYNGKCGCDDYHYFDPVAFACVPCLDPCSTCIDSSFKTCLQCGEGFWKDPTSFYCLSFCPTGFTMDEPTKMCKRPVNFERIFDITLKTWDSSMKYTIENESGTWIQLGDTMNYEEDDPWLVRRGDIGMFAFDGVDDFLTIRDNNKQPGLLMSHTFSLMSWVSISSATGILFSKTTSDRLILQIGIEGGSLFYEFEDGQIFIRSAVERVKPDQWIHIAVSFSLRDAEDTITDARIYQNRVVVSEESMYGQVYDDLLSMNYFGWDGNKQQFLEGSIYELFILSDKTLSLHEWDLYSIAEEPPFSTCGSSEGYSENSCIYCTVDRNNSQGTVFTQNNACTICASALCTQCTEAASESCKNCKPLSILEHPGTCVCTENAWSHDGMCEVCHSYWGSCNGPTPYKCTKCINEYMLQEDSFTCTDICPTGCLPSGNTCQCHDKEMFEYRFDQITKQWDDEKTDVLFVAGDTADEEGPMDPMTYKQRGAYFDGIEKRLTLEISSDLYLHHTMTLESWIFAVDDGVLFSKTWNWTKSEFLRIRISLPDMSVAIRRDTEISEKTVIENLNAAAWTFVAVTFEYDSTKDETSLCGFANRQQTSQNVLDNISIVDRKLSSGRIGAESGEEARSFFKGFIFYMKLQRQALGKYNLASRVSTHCGQLCDICPSGSVCLWQCMPDEFQGGDGQCHKWPSCPDHPQKWDGWVRASSCQLCVSKNCTSCSDFSSDAQCLDCNGRADCSCESGWYHDEKRDQCVQCDAFCEECQGDTRWDCTSCDEDYINQPFTSFCYSFCPKGWEQHGKTCVMKHELVLYLQFTEVYSNPIDHALDSQPEQPNESKRSIPVKHRGHHFNGEQWWLIEDLTLNHSHTITAWVYPEKTRQETVILLKSHFGLPMSQLGLDTHNKVTFSNQDPQMSLKGDESDQENEWQFIAFRLEYMSNHNSLLSIWTNDVLTQIETLPQIFYKEYEHSMTYIGANEDGYMGYVGFMFHLKIFNDAAHYELITDEVAIMCQGSCSFCPSSHYVCLSTCPLGTYGPDCTPCDPDCNGNWVREGNGADCTLCDNRMCTECIKFEAGPAAQCLTCLANAQVVNGDCTCVDSVLSVDPFECMCVNQCEKCYELEKWSCLSCADGYFMQADSDMCLFYCGQGYEEFGSDCIGGPVRELRKLNDIRLDSLETDPWPAKQRGYYFNGTTHFLAEVIILHHTWTIDVFIKPTHVPEQKQVIFTRFRSQNERLEILTDFGFLNFYYVNGNDASVSLASGQISTDSWSYILVNWLWSQESTSTTITMYIDTILAGQSNQMPQLVIENERDWQGFIGKAGGIEMEDRYTGFIAEIGFSNYLVAVDVNYSTECEGSMCDFCPSSDNNCLGLCDITEFQTERQECLPCYESCTRGCVRADSCTICAHSGCGKCDGFAAENCLEWVPGKTQFIHGVCQCQDPSDTLYSDVTGECYSCHENCRTCEVSVFDNSLLKCHYCATGFFMHNSLCIDYCPIGFSKYRQNCHSVTPKSLMVHYENFDQFSTTMVDSASKYKAIIANEGQLPLLQERGGLFFNGSSVMRLPPNDDDESSILLNQKHSIQLIIKPDDKGESSFSYLVTKSDVYEIALDSEKVVIQARLASLLVGQEPETSFHEFEKVHNDKWLLLTISVELDTNMSTTDWTVYSNSVSLGIRSDINKYVIDGAEYDFQFGGRLESGVVTSPYFGNLYDFKIYNYALQLDDLFENQLQSVSCGCPQCFQKECVTPCKFSEYLDQTDFTCHPCLSSCHSGCLRPSDCKLNIDPLCQDYDSIDRCNGCVKLATNINDVCTCVDNTYHQVQSSICLCKQDYREIQPGVCTICRRFVLPEEISSSFDPWLRYIEIRFEVLIRADGLNAPEDMISQSSVLKLGDNSNLIWTHESTASVAKISLGTNATIKQEEIELIGEKLYTHDPICPNSVTQLSVYVEYPGELPQPTAYIVAPTLFSRNCGTLQIDGGNSRSNIESPVTYHWKMELDGRELREKTSESSVVNIDGNQLDEGQLKITLEVTNRLSQSSTVEQVVTIIDAPTPTLLVQEETDFMLHKSTYREFIVSIAADGCFIDSSKFTFTSQERSVSSTLNISNTRNKLVIEPFSLPKYKTYWFSAQLNTSTVEIPISITPAAIVARVSPHNGKFSIQNELVIDASQSYDPDNPNADLKFKWSCVMTQGDTCINRYDTELLEYLDTPKIIIPANTLYPNEVHTFTVEISNQYEKVKRVITLETFEESAPAISALHIPDRLSTSRTNRIIFDVSDDNAVSQWESDIPGAIYHDMYALVHPHVLKQGQQYTVQFSSQLGDGTPSTATLSLVANSPPMFGRFQADKTEGIELTTSIQFSASDWQDVEYDYPIHYAFLYKVEDQLWMNLNKPGLIQYLNTTFPFIEEQQEVMLRVYDNMQYWNEEVMNIKVTPLSDWKKEEIIFDLVDNLETMQADRLANILAVLPTHEVDGKLHNYDVFAAFRRWIESNPEGTWYKFDTFVSLFYKVCQLPEAATEEVTAPDSTSEVLMAEALMDDLKIQIEKAVRNGVEITSVHLNSLLRSIFILLQTPTQLEKVIGSLRQAYLELILPFEPEYRLQNIGAFQKLAIDNLREHVWTLEGTKSSVKLANDNSTYSTHNTLVDSSFIKYPKHTGSTGSRSDVIGFDLNVENKLGSGLYTSQPIQASLNITIGVEEMALDFNPQCAYLVPNNSTKEQLWSTKGCRVERVDTAKSQVICICDHMSIYTANEGLATSLSNHHPGYYYTPEYEVFPVMAIIIIVLVIGVTFAQAADKLCYTPSTSFSTFQESSEAPGGSGDRESPTKRQVPEVEIPETGYYTTWNILNSHLIIGFCSKVPISTILRLKWILIGYLIQISVIGLQILAEDEVTTDEADGSTVIIYSIVAVIFSTSSICFIIFLSKHSSALGLVVSWMISMVSVVIGFFLSFAMTVDESSVWRQALAAGVLEDALLAQCAVMTVVHFVYNNGKSNHHRRGYSIVAESGNKE